jgi:RHS repeat-associated protein
MTQETLGNGVVINRSFDPVALRLSSITAAVGGGASLENQSYLYDAVGNVIQRQEGNLGLSESFYYDALNRLRYSQLESQSTGTTTNLQMCYDNTGGGCSDTAPGPGTITSKTADALAPSSYTAAWTSYNYPSKIATASESLQFSYGPDRQRWQQNYNNGAEVTNYVGGLLEQVVTSGGTAYRQYVYAGSEPVAVVVPSSSSGDTVTYMLSDHQGSVAALLNTTGGTDVSESFTAYGARRSPSSWSGAPSAGDLTTIAGLTRQGYAFQTAVGQSMGFNHMNGRVEDAISGQFLLPDPYLPDPGNTQDYNRYAYVDNNPLSFIDPSGFDASLDCPNQQECSVFAPTVSRGTYGGSSSSTLATWNFTQDEANWLNMVDQQLQLAAQDLKKPQTTNCPSSDLSTSRPSYGQRVVNDANATNQAVGSGVLKVGTTLGTRALSSDVFGTTAITPFQTYLTGAAPIETNFGTLSGLSRVAGTVATRVGGGCGGLWCLESRQLHWSCDWKYLAPRRSDYYRRRIRVH